MTDLKFALRQLLKNPGFTAVAVLTLALGMELATSTLSIVNRYLLRSLPLMKSLPTARSRSAPAGSLGSSQQSL